MCLLNTYVHSCLHPCFEQRDWAHCQAIRFPRRPGPGPVVPILLEDCPNLEKVEWVVDTKCTACEVQSRTGVDLLALRAKARAFRTQTRNEHIVRRSNGTGDSARSRVIVNGTEKKSEDQTQKGYRTGTAGLGNGAAGSGGTSEAAFEASGGIAETSRKAGPAPCPAIGIARTDAQAGAAGVKEGRKEQERQAAASQRELVARHSMETRELDMCEIRGKRLTQIQDQSDTHNHSVYSTNIAKPNACGGKDELISKVNGTFNPERKPLRLILVKKSLLIKLKLPRPPPPPLESPTKTLLESPLEDPPESPPFSPARSFSPPPPTSPDTDGSSSESDGLSPRSRTFVRRVSHQRWHDGRWVVVEPGSKRGPKPLSRAETLATLPDVPTLVMPASSRVRRIESPPPGDESPNSAKRRKRRERERAYRSTDEYKAREKARRLAKKQQLSINAANTSPVSDSFSMAGSSPSTVREGAGFTAPRPRSASIRDDSTTGGLTPLHHSDFSVPDQTPTELEKERKNQEAKERKNARRREARRREKEARERESSEAVAPVSSRDKEEQSARKRTAADGDDVEADRGVKRVRIITPDTDYDHPGADELFHDSGVEVRTTTHGECDSEESEESEEL